MKILYKSNPNISKRDIYKMTQDASIKSMKDIESDSIIDVQQYIYYEDENARGEIAHILAIMSESGEVWTTTSKTFQRSFDMIAELMEDEQFSIKKKEGISKVGRAYVDCSLV